MKKLLPLFLLLYGCASEVRLEPVKQASTNARVVTDLSLNRFEEMQGLLRRYRRDNVFVVERWQDLVEFSTEFQSSDLFSYLDYDELEYLADTGFELSERVRGICDSWNAFGDSDGRSVSAYIIAFEEHVSNLRKFPFIADDVERFFHYVQLKRLTTEVRRIDAYMIAIDELRSEARGLYLEHVCDVSLQRLYGEREFYLRRVELASLHIE
jgi:hypothetical protein